MANDKKKTGTSKTYSLETDPRPGAAEAREDARQESGEAERLNGKPIDEYADHEALPIGSKVLIRGTPWAYIGVVRKITPAFIGLFPCVWVADLQRLTGVLQTGIGTSELEPFIDLCWVRHECVTEVTPWPHAVPDKAQ